MAEKSLFKQFEEEKEHSAFLEKLLCALYGNGWDDLTIFDAKKWYEEHKECFE